MEKLIMIKYGELSTKKGNRNMFIRLLEKNILSSLKEYDLKIKKDHSRMYINVDNKHIDNVAKRLKNIFGIHGIVVAYKVNNNTDDIKEKVLEVINNIDLNEYKTFKVVTKRADKNFAIPSMEFNNIIGGLVLKNSSLSVDVHKPDLFINIEIRIDGAFIYLNELRGSGGYPVGVQGKGLLMLSGGIDSPVAGYLALKRGVDLECLYFESPPHTSALAKNKVIELANIINQYSGNIKLHIVPFTKIQETIYKNIPHNYNITIMRRMMYRIAEAVAKKNNCKAIINGESIGQVASQTLDSVLVINEVTNFPVIRSVACLDKIEIVNLSKKIKTYETSILPYEDCCTVFVPKHPVINPTIQKCLKYETTFDYQPLIDECITNIETITDLTKKHYDNLL